MFKISICRVYGPEDKFECGHDYSQHVLTRCEADKVFEDCLTLMKPYPFAVHMFANDHLVRCEGPTPTAVEKARYAAWCRRNTGVKA